jgi:hypothetical protein
MKNLKILGLTAVIGAALMALAGSASATTVTTTTGGAAATPTIHMVNEGGHLKFANAIANIECSSTYEGTVTSHGSGVTAEVGLTNFSLTGCTNSWHITTITPGSLIIHWTSGYNGTVTWTGAKWDSTRFGITCVYQTNNTSIGTLTGGNPATLKLEASIPISAGESSGLCGSGNIKWEGSYVTTSALYIAP